MVIEYALARRMICDVADRVSDAAGLRVLFDRRSFDGRFHNGLYHKRNDYISETGGFAAGDRFLLNYIAKHDSKVFCFYDFIRDEMPELSPFEKMQRKFYRTSHGLPDVNAYDSPGR